MLWTIHEREGGGMASTVELTEREHQVVTWLSRGDSTDAIAEKLQVSDRTVKTIIGQLCEKLEVRNRTELVAHALRAKLIK